MSAYVWLSLGSNIGDKAEFLRFAIQILQAHPQIKVDKVSSLYITAPWGVEEQEDYYNAVAGIITELEPEELLAYINKLEEMSGRVREQKWAARQLDIDILLYGDLIIKQENLTVPHPHMAERRFVLIPLLEAAGDINIPAFGNIKYLLAACADKQKVEKLITDALWYGGVL